MKSEVRFLKETLEIYSPTGHTGQMGEYLVNWCKDHGMAAEVKNGMVVINPNAEALLMLGHMDTVPGMINVEQKNGTIYGRGAADAKGPLCAAICALEKHPALREKTCIVAAHDEEGESKAALHIRENWKERPCIILEPSTWSAITLSYMGRLFVQCKTKCPQSHPGHQSPFATEELAKTWKLLSEANIARIRSIDGNDTEGSMVLDIRFRGAKIEDIISKIPKNIETKILEKTMPYTALKNTSLVRSFLKAVRESGGIPVFKKKTGTSDMNVLGEKWKQAPMVAYGPGDGRLGHTDREHINIEDYLKGIGVLEKVLVYLNNRPN